MGVPCSAVKELLCVLLLVHAATGTTAMIAASPQVELGQGSLQDLLWQVPVHLTQAAAEGIPATWQAQLQQVAAQLLGVTGASPGTDDPAFHDSAAGSTFQALQESLLSSDAVKHILQQAWTYLNQAVSGLSADESPASVAAGTAMPSDGPSAMPAAADPYCVVLPQTLCMRLRRWNKYTIDALLVYILGNLTVSAAGLLQAVIQLGVGTGVMNLGIRQVLELLQHASMMVTLVAAVVGAVEYRHLFGNMLM